jgi:hypothetical protein
MERLGKIIGVGVLGGIAAYLICSTLDSSVRPSEWEPAIKGLWVFLVLFAVWAFSFEEDI